MRQRPLIHSLSLSLSFSTRSLSLSFNCEYFHYKIFLHFSHFGFCFSLLGLSLRAPKRFITQIWAQFLHTGFFTSDSIISLIQVSFNFFNISGYPFAWFNSMINWVVDLTLLLCVGGSVFFHNELVVFSLGS